MRTSEEGADKYFRMTLSKLHQIHQHLMMIYIAATFYVIVMTCYLGYIVGSATKYTDIETQWQSCFTQQIYVTSTQDPSLRLPVGELLQSFSYLGYQTIIFSLVGHGALNRAIRHPSWFPSTIVFMVWTTVSILTYYMVEPVLPIPSETNPTLLLFMSYFNQKIFNNINDGNNACQSAYIFSWAFIAGMLIILLIQIATTFLAIIGEYFRYNDPRRVHPPPLTCTRPPVYVLVLLIAFYTLIIVSKIMASENALNAITSFNLTPQEAFMKGYVQWFPQSFFPFQMGSLDINALMFVSVIMSITRGYSQQSASAYRLAGSMAFIYALTAFPSLTTAYR